MDKSHDTERSKLGNIVSLAVEHGNYPKTLFFMLKEKLAALASKTESFRDTKKLASLALSPTEQ